MEEVLTIFRIYSVKVEYPLKQGLKQSPEGVFDLYIDNVKVEYPLKQGLKQPLQQELI